MEDLRCLAAHSSTRVKAVNDAATALKKARARLLELILRETNPSSRRGA